MSIILTLLTFLLLINTGFWIFYYLFFPNIHQKEGNIDLMPFVSVVIATKNDVDHLKISIPALIDQDYPRYEIIVIDDQSSDDTLSLLYKLKKGYPQLRTISIKSSQPGKRDAIRKGVNLATGEFILLTDADARPSPYWISSSIAAITQNDSNVCLQYGPQIREQGCLNTLTRAETILTAIQYFTWAKVGLPYMGVGRNIIYDYNTAKKLFDNRHEFPTAGGDDDLTIQRHHSKLRFTYNLDPQSFVYSEGPKSLVQWLNQKSRHISTSFHYSLKIKLLLGLFGMSQVSYLLFVLYLVSSGWFFIVLILIISRWCIHHFLGKRIFKSLHEESLRKYFALWELIISLYYIIILAPSFFRKKNKW